MKSPVFAFLAVLLCYINLSDEIKNGFMCQPVEDSCAPTQAPVTQGRQGKIGPKGVKGELGDVGTKGDKGSSGVVDYGRVNATIESNTRDLVAKISNLESTIRKMKNSIFETAYKWCQYLYKGICYWAIVHAEFDIPSQKTLEFCKQWDMEPAEITGAEMLEKVKRYVATKIPHGSTSADIRIGMSYNPANKELKFNNGSRASFVKWYPGYPKSDSGRIGVGMVAQKNAGNKLQGMYNLHVTGKVSKGILCQKKRDNFLQEMTP